MNKLFQVSVIIYFSLLMLSCTRYDSDKINHKLIQGKWEQVQIAYPSIDADTLITEKPEGITTLKFQGDSCTEEFVDLEEINLYSFQIRDYRLGLQKDDAELNILDVNKLTKDSLILQSKNRYWRYIRNAD